MTNPTIYVNRFRVAENYAEPTVKIMFGEAAPDGTADVMHVFVQMSEANALELVALIENRIDLKRRKMSKENIDFTAAANIKPLKP
jgi:hypothetical protein